jgi:MFS family permease
MLLALAGPGTLLGALIAVKTGRRFGLGPTMIGGIALAGLSNLLIPVAYLLRGEFLLPFGLLALASFLNGLGQPFYNINQVSLRQAITPDHLRGRVSATMQFVAGGTGPIGALVGGILGQLFGPPLIVTLAALGTLFALTWLLFSGIWFLSEPPKHS